MRDSWDDGGVEVESFRYAPTFLERLGYSRSLSADEKVRFAAGLVTGPYLLAARRACRRQVRSRAYDLVHAHWVVPNGLVVASLSGSIPVAVGLHGSDVFMAEKPLVRAAVARALRSTSVLTGCSPELVDRVCALGFPRERSAVIPYGVDVETFSPGGEAGQWREKLGIPARAVVALSVGRMVTKKGYQVLLEVAPGLLDRHRDLHLVLAGAGDRLEEFRARTAHLGGRVHYPGVVYRDDLPSLYRSADLFVLPAVHDSKGNVDGLPNVILEAMASGLPVVASEISGIPLAVEEGVNGLLVPEGAAASLAAAVSALVVEPERRRELGAAARGRAEAELTWTVIAGRYRQAYLELGGASERGAG